MSSYRTQLRFAAIAGVMFPILMLFSTLNHAVGYVLPPQYLLFPRALLGVVSGMFFVVAAVGHVGGYIYVARVCNSKILRVAALGQTVLIGVLGALIMGHVYSAFLRFDLAQVFNVSTGLVGIFIFALEPIFFYALVREYRRLGNIVGLAAFAPIAILLTWGMPFEAALALAPSIYLLFKISKQQSLVVSQ